MLSSPTILLGSRVAWSVPLLTFVPEAATCTPQRRDPSTSEDFSSLPPRYVSAIEAAAVVKFKISMNIRNLSR